MEKWFGWRKAIKYCCILNRWENSLEKGVLSYSKRVLFLYSGLFMDMICFSMNIFGEKMILSFNFLSDMSTEMTCLNGTSIFTSWSMFP